jgi:hypothetical protein
MLWARTSWWTCTAWAELAAKSDRQRWPCCWLTFVGLAWHANAPLPPPPPNPPKSAPIHSCAVRRHRNFPSRPPMLSVFLTASSLPCKPAMHSGHTAVAPGASAALGRIVAHRNKTKHCPTSLVLLHLL